jgi:molecular chaperone GrpE (heat shock protein)
MPAEPADEVSEVSSAGPRTKPRSLSPIAPSGNDPEANSLALHDDGFLPRTLGNYGTSRRATLMTRKPAEEEDSPTAVLMSDGTSDQEWSPDVQWPSAGAAVGGSCDDIIDPPQFGNQPTAPTVGTEKPAAEVPNVLKEQAEDLQRQLAEFKQVAQSVQQASQQGSAEPITNTLKELAQQVSAIRDYAASQQNRVEKLQDGYDWTIIRTFCLRVIRCIDNVEKRIEDLGKDDGTTAHLEEIRDELIFALESSGVEKFEPELNTEFHGQERIAEAVKEKQTSNKPDRVGKIAKVLRSGYRYIIDDDNYKVVRTAQVKLFG